jgi:regulator of sigma E protease
VGTFIGIVVSIIGLGFLILAHEFGHFIVAKLTGMRVEEFSLGFGRYLISKRIGETIYGISAVPLGGYVRVTGMHKEEFDQRIAEAREEEAEGRRPRDPEDRLAGARALSADEIASTPLDRRYYAHPFWHKILFIVAGVFMNLVVAFLLFWAAGLLNGQNISSNVISEVAQGSPAAAAGMKAGDAIISVAGAQVSDFNGVRTQILTHAGERVTVVVKRGTSIVSLSVDVQKKSDGTGYLGVGATSLHQSLGFVDSFTTAAKSSWDTIVLIFKGIWWMITGRVPVTGSNGLAGTIGIIQISTEAVQGGYYLALLALISINLAILNMIPLLPLDGGHALFSVIERIRGKSISLKTFERVSVVGLVLFVLLFIVATSNDIGRLFGA